MVLDSRMDIETLALGKLLNYKILHLDLPNIGQLVDKHLNYYIMKIQEKNLIRVQSSYDLKFIIYLASCLKKRNKNHHLLIHRFYKSIFNANKRIF